MKAAYGDITQQGIDEFRREISEKVNITNSTSCKPYPIYMPIGTCLCSPGDIPDCDKMLSSADEAMYADKIRLKSVTGFDPKRK